MKKKEFELISQDPNSIKKDGYREVKNTFISVRGISNYDFFLITFLYKDIKETIKKVVHLLSSNY